MTAPMEIFLGYDILFIHSWHACIDTHVDVISQIKPTGPQTVKFTARCNCKQSFFSPFQPCLQTFNQMASSVYKIKMPALGFSVHDKLGFSNTGKGLCVTMPINLRTQPLVSSDYK